MTTVIEISGLTKNFGHVRALDGLDLAVHAGEIHGFLGPNGAGKSTTLRILLGLVRPSAGTCRIFGQSPGQAEVQRRLAYVPGDVSLWPNLTGGQIIDLLGRLRGGLDPARRADLLERFDLDPTRKARTYSKGNRQKVALIAALASNAELLLVDEPTSGLDPLMETVFADYVRDLRTEGCTVLLSSHILSEVEALADRVTLLRAGRNIETGSLAQLRHLHNTRVRAELAHPRPGLAEVPGIQDLVETDGEVGFTVATDALDRAIAELSVRGIRSLTCEPVSLEELFLAQYETPAPATPRLPEPSRS
ncbi:ABC transporter ATP-binding protein [Granulicoccus phenolivorans]|uniref:ABC transporter ATP-binding protein n=1 Tax=Granulicoccus phenolivorans TaxID=266854 RepID=UPI0004255DC3|nr:ABC transporter ATP-binding protein [Granulicoccus phenolivorans]